MATIPCLKMVQYVEPSCYDKNHDEAAGAMRSTYLRLTLGWPQILRQ